MDQVLGPFGEPSSGDILHERNPRLRLEQIGQIGRVQTADRGKTPSVKPGIKIFFNEVQQFDKAVQIFSRPVRLFIQKRREKQVQRGPCPETVSRSKTRILQRAGIRKETEQLLIKRRILHLPLQTVIEQGKIIQSRIHAESIEMTPELLQTLRTAHMNPDKRRHQKKSARNQTQPDVFQNNFPGPPDRKIKPCIGNHPERLLETFRVPARIQFLESCHMNLQCQTALIPFHFPQNSLSLEKVTQPRRECKSESVKSSKKYVLQTKENCGTDFFSL